MIAYPSLLYAARTYIPSSVITCGTPGSGILTVGFCSCAPMGADTGYSASRPARARNTGFLRLISNSLLGNLNVWRRYYSGASRPSLSLLTVVRDEKIQRGQSLRTCGMWL